jgi:hypothetical protein
MVRAHCLVENVSSVSGRCKILAILSRHNYCWACLPSLPASLFVPTTSALFEVDVWQTNMP